MADATEIERLLVRLVGDNKLYVETLNEAERRTQNFTQDASGRFRDMKGRFVSAAVAMEAQAGATLKRIYDLGNALKSAGEAADRAGKKMREAGSYLSLRVTAPLIGMGVAAAKTAGSFETTFARMQGLAGVAASEVEHLQTNVMALSTATGRGPQELAESLYNIRSSGVAGQTALDTLEVSAKAAAAGLGETRDISDAVTSAINAYGAANMEASRATDILVATVREGKAEANEIAPVMGRLIPVASSMGIQFEEVAGLMAVMSRTGSDAAEASTSIGAILNTLLSPSKQAADALASVGLSMETLREMAKEEGGLINVMRLLHRQFGDNEEALSAIIPEVRAFRGVMNVLAQDAALVNGVMANVRNSVGATESAFKAVAGTIEHEWNRAWNGVVQALIAAGNSMKPVLIALFDQVTQLANWFTSLDDSTKQYIVTAAAIAAALGPALIVLGAMVSAVGKVIAVFGTLMTSARALVAIMGVAKLALGGFAVAGVALLVIGANKAARALLGMNQELERTKKLSNEMQGVLQRQFTREFESLGDLPVEEQKAKLQEMAQNIQRTAEANAVQLSRYKEEIKALEDQNVFSRTFDAHGIELAKGHLEDARQRAEMYQNQLDQVQDKIKQLGSSAAGSQDPLMGNIRPEAIKEFSDQMEAELVKLRARFEGTTQGRGEGEIGRMEALASLQAELEAQGKELTAEEQRRLGVLNAQLTAKEKQLEAFEKEKKAAEEAQKKAEEQRKSMASRAEQIMKASLSPLQELKLQIDEINKLQREGFMTAEEAKAAQQGLVSDFASQDKVAKASAGDFVKFGSAEAETMRLQETKDKSTEKGVWKMVDKMDVNIRTQEQILEELRKDEEEVVSIGPS